ncbi:hypothetical protein [Actibacterium sp.]|uniref:hypothetical protein n=1 Tax=Actibacterium sp. TaxID=1872125 RepID=UPI0035691E6F
MLFKIIVFFLLGMAVLAMFGRLRLPGGGRVTGLAVPKKCKHCGRYNMGSGPCPCGKG